MDLVLPNENIDPRLKQQPDFLLKYAKACWNTNFSGSFQKIFFRNQARYEEIMDYALGMQSNSKYKPLMGVDEADNETWLKIDWSIRKIVPKFRNIAISKMCETKYNTNCTPIDPIAKSELDKYFAGATAKIIMRDALKKKGSPLQHAAVLQPKGGEPNDMQELKMQKDFGAKTELSMEAELGIEVVFNENNVQEQRKQIITNTFDFGVGVYKDWIDENMRVRTRVVDPRFFGTNYCRKNNFSDMEQAWEIIEVSLSDLAVVFPDPNIIEDIKNNAANRNYANGGSTGTRGWVQGFDPNKARVMDLEFISYDTDTKEMRVDSAGNLKITKADHQYRNNQTQKVKLPNGKEQPAYSSKKVKNVYKIKWVIGTDYCYDYGLATNQKRDTNPRKANDVKLSYHVYAPNFHEMKANSIMEALIPIADEYQLTCYRIQNFKNRWLPYVVSIDLGAMEDVAMGAGGAKMTPRELLNTLFQTNIAVGRKKDLGGATGNNKMVDVEPTGMATEFETLAKDLDRILQDLRNISGLNEVTDGSTPGERNLNSTNEAAIAGTNNALSPIIEGDKWLLESLAIGVFQRLQVAVAIGGQYGGYYDSLGANTLKAFSVSKNICLHYYGIKLEERVSDEQKQMLMQLMAPDIQNGFLSTADVYLITSMYNVKQAYQYLNYKIESNKAKQQAAAQQASGAAAQQQGQQAQQLEQMKQKGESDKAASDLVYLNTEKAWDLVISEASGVKQLNQAALQESLKLIGAVTTTGMQNGMMPPGAQPQQGAPAMPPQAAQGQPQQISQPDAQEPEPAAQ